MHIASTHATLGRRKVFKFYPALLADARSSSKYLAGFVCRLRVAPALKDKLPHVVEGQPRPQDEDPFIP